MRHETEGQTLIKLTWKERKEKGKAPLTTAREQHYDGKRGLLSMQYVTTLSKRHVPAGKYIQAAPGISHLLIFQT